MLDKYHHGNLKQDLIEKGLAIINEEGEKALSFRRVASACGVSHTAAYAHFSDKDDMIKAIKETVAYKFAEELKKAVDESEDQSPEGRIVAMGRRYVTFFMQRPDYFKFLFGNQLVNVHFDVDKDYAEDFPAFRLLKSIYLEMCENKGNSRELIRIWSSVHGLASIACMDNVVYEGAWDELILELVK